MIDISIIIPHYNRSNMIKRLLDSISPHERIEIIIVDDRSSSFEIENLKAIIKEYFIKIILIENDTNKKGAGVARNIGLKNFSGKWVIFADSDDFFVKDIYEVFKPYIESELELVYFMPTSINAKSKEKGTKHIVYKNNIERYIGAKSKETELYLKTHWGVPWSILISSKHILNSNFQFDQIKASEDFLPMTKLGINASKIEADSNTYYCIVEEEGSLSADHILDKEMDIINANVYGKYFVFLKEKLDKKMLSKMEIQCLSLLIKFLLQTKSIKRTIQQLKIYRNYKVPLINWLYLKRKIIK